MLSLTPNFVPYNPPVPPNMDFIRTSTWRNDPVNYFTTHYNGSTNPTSAFRALFPVDDTHFVAVISSTSPWTTPVYSHVVNLYQTGSNGTNTRVGTASVSFPGLVLASEPKRTPQYIDVKQVNGFIVIIAYVPISWQSALTPVFKKVKHVYDTSGGALTLVRTVDPYVTSVGEDTEELTNIAIASDTPSWPDTVEFDEQNFPFEFSAKIGTNYVNAFLRHKKSVGEHLFEVEFRHFEYGAQAELLSSGAILKQLSIPFQPSELTSDFNIEGAKIKTTQIGPKHVLVTVSIIASVGSPVRTDRRYEAFLVDWTAATPTVTSIESFVVDVDVQPYIIVMRIEPADITQGSKTLFIHGEPGETIDLLFYPPTRNGASRYWKYGSTIYNPTAEKAFNSLGFARAFVGVSNNLPTLLKYDYEAVGTSAAESDRRIEGFPNVVAHTGSMTHTASFMGKVATQDTVTLYLYKFNAIDFAAMLVYGTKHKNSSFTPREIRSFNNNFEFNIYPEFGVGVGNKMIHLGRTRPFDQYINASWRNFITTLEYKPLE